MSAAADATVTISMPSGVRRVPAVWQQAGLAVHGRWQLKRSGVYTVTHVRSGLSVLSHVRGEAQAIAAARALLEAGDWDRDTAAVRADLALLVATRRMRRTLESQA